MDTSSFAMFDVLSCRQMCLFDDLVGCQRDFPGVSISINILSVNEKLPVSKFRYFGKYTIQLFGYCNVHVSGQRQAGLAR